VSRAVPCESKQHEGGERHRRRPFLIDQQCVVLKDNEPPFAINVLESGRIDGDFKTYAALVYGKCEILPDDTDRCEIGIGLLFTKVGSL
jgi:hypothetical protein